MDRILRNVKIYIVYLLGIFTSNTFSKGCIMPSWDIHEKYARLMGIPVQVAKWINRFTDDPRWHDFYNSMLTRYETPVLRALGGRIIIYEFDGSIFYTRNWEDVRKIIERFGANGWRAFFLHVWLDKIEENMRSGKRFALLRIEDISGYFKEYIEEVGGFIQERWDEVWRDIEDYITARRRKRPVREYMYFIKFVKLVERRARELGLEYSPVDAERWFKEEWKAIKKLSGEELDNAIQYLANEYLAKLPRGMQSPKSPSISETVSTHIFSWNNLTAEEREYYLTAGPENFAREYGAKYRILYPDDLLGIIENVAYIIHSIGETLQRTAKTFLDWQAGYWLVKYAHMFARYGIYNVLREIWSDIIVQANSFFRDYNRKYGTNYSLPSQTTFVVVDEEGRPHSYGGGRIWVETVAYRMYEVLGAAPPSDLVAAYLLFRLWKENGYPPEITTSITYTGALP